jgi:hypothetical protein
MAMGVLVVAPSGTTKLSRAGTHSFRAYLREIDLHKNRANECERIA